MEKKMKRFVKALAMIILNDALTFCVLVPFWSSDILELTFVQWLLCYIVWGLVTILIASSCVRQHTLAKTDDCNRKDLSIVSERS